MIKSKIVFIILGVLSFSITQALAFEGKDAENYKKGRLLFLANDGDYSLKAKKELETAIDLFEPLLNRSNIESEIFFMLADAYRNIAIVHFSNDSIERLKLLWKEREVMFTAVELNPNDVRTLSRYASSLSGKERVSILEKIISIDNNNAQAYDSLSSMWAASMGEPDKALKYGKKAYELANYGEKEDIGQNLLSKMYHHSKKIDYIQFHLRYRNDMARISNLRLPLSKDIEITLELKEENSLYTKDSVFIVVFTNISNKPIKLLNHQKISHDFFKFQGYPETDYQFRFTLPYDDSYSFDSGDRPRYIELQPNEKYIVKTSFNEIFFDSWKLEERVQKDDKGYIVLLRYRGAVINDRINIRHSAYSNAVHIKLVEKNDE